MEESINSNGGGGGGERSNKDQQLKILNKNSYKISKPTTSSNNSNNNSVKNQSFDQNQNQSNNIQVVRPPPPTAVYHQQSASLFPQEEDEEDQNLPLPPAPHHQPPVYNINKSDFREIVQRLTGAPPRDRFSNPPPPINQPRPSSSRLQRIRPPPLSHVGNRPVNPRPRTTISQPGSYSNGNNAMGNQIQNPSSAINNPAPVNFSSGYMPRPVGPHSPLPPFPAVHTAAESPVSAYMRYFQNASPGISGFSTSTPPPPPAEPQNPQFAVTAPPLTSGSSSSSQSSPPQFQMPTSPLPFGCMNPPLSPYPLHSPTSSQFAFPLSPAASPKWKGI